MMKKPVLSAGEKKKVTVEQFNSMEEIFNGKITEFVTETHLLLLKFSDNDNYYYMKMKF